MGLNGKKGPEKRSEKRRGKGGEIAVNAGNYV
jgi:hypothetical protein